MNRIPFDHEIRDDLFGSDLVSAAARDWPSAEWDGWFEYTGQFEISKMTCNNWQVMPKPCVVLLRLLLGLTPQIWLGDRQAIPDINLHGAGMHAMGRDSKLDVHLDADRHPKNGLQRACNAILFLNETWKPEWGGALEFWNSDVTKCVTRIEPRFNRLVMFDTSDDSYHGIPEPLKCPPGILRKSLAVYFWRDAPGEVKRPRARYVARPQDDHDPKTEAERLRRAGL
jgi:hypothetical protein